METSSKTPLRKNTPLSMGVYVFFLRCSWRYELWFGANNWSINKNLASWIYEDSCGGQVKSEIYSGCGFLLHQFGWTGNYCIDVFFVLNTVALNVIENLPMSQLPSIVIIKNSIINEMGFWYLDDHILKVTIYSSVNLYVVPACNPPMIIIFTLRKLSY